MAVGDATRYFVGRPFPAEYFELSDGGGDFVLTVTYVPFARGIRFSSRVDTSVVLELLQMQLQLCRPFTLPTRGL